MKTDSFTAITMMVLLLVLAVGALVFNAWVFTVLWAWFIVPIFSLPALNIFLAYGLILVARYPFNDLYVKLNQIDTAIKNLVSPTETAVQKTATTVVIAWLTPLAFLGIGWIALQFV